MTKITNRITKFIATLGLILSSVASFAADPVAAGANITFSWQPVPAGGVQYRVYWGTTSKVYQNSVDVGMATTVTITNLALDTRYFFAVSSFNGLGMTSPRSDEAAYTTTSIPTTPPGFSLVSVDVFQGETVFHVPVICTITNDGTMYYRSVLNVTNK